MKQASVFYQRAEWWRRSSYFTILHSLFIIALLLCSSTAALAVCQTTSIIASTPTADFIANGNGTVTHTKTGLVWKVCSEGQTWSTGLTCTNAATPYTWETALQQAQTVNGAGFAGKSDWRVPNKTELTSIVETQCVNPSINAAIFTASSLKYWSSSPYAGSATSAWFVDFFNGNISAISKTTNLPVRLVRGGP